MYAKSATDIESVHALPVTRGGCLNKLKSYVATPLTIALVHHAFQCDLSPVHERCELRRGISRDMTHLISANILDLDGVPTMKGIHRLHLEGG